MTHLNNLFEGEPFAHDHQNQYVQECQVIDKTNKTNFPDGVPVCLDNWQVVSTYSMIFDFIISVNFHPIRDPPESMDHKGLEAEVYRCELSHLP